MTIATATTEEILTSDARLDPCKPMTANALAKVSQCRFGAYIEDIFVLGTDEKEVIKVYDQNYSAFQGRSNVRNPQNVCGPLKTPRRSWESNLRPME